MGLMITQKEIIDKYPRFFNDYYTFKFDKFECGNGWNDIIDKLCKDIEEILTTLGTVNIKVVQVKEKFGGLRFYIEWDPETQRTELELSNKIYTTISAAENESMKTCEECGQPGKQTTIGNWIQTLCNKHYEIKNTNFIIREIIE